MCCSADRSPGCTRVTFNPQEALGIMQDKPLQAIMHGEFHLRFPLIYLFYLMCVYNFTCFLEVYANMTYTDLPVDRSIVL